ncbi:hypothetical protein AGMMS49975_23580 [Clostridia bacterium]|nr:hypothetical protein AGMMS49975_23580 [Clostridia bacterium]
MEVNERIHYLRKYILKKTQSEFADKIKISRSNLGNIENGNVNITERVLNDISREFSVNTEWLNKGIEPILSDSKEDTVNRIVKIYDSLSEPNRKYLEGYIYRLFEEQQAQIQQ